MIAACTRLKVQAFAGLALALACVPAAAQPTGQAQQPSAAMQGFSANRDQPVRIESNTMEVRDKIRQATFSGDVKLVQGDTTLKCKVLVVFYEDTPPPAPKKGEPPQAQQKSGGQQIKRAEAKGDVFIVQKDQTASGENGIYDLKSNTFLITGNVVVTQGQAVTRGERMLVNLTTGVTTVEATKASGGRVEFMTVPGAAKDAKGAPAPAPAAPPPAAAQPPATPPSAKATPKGPMRIN